MRSWKVPAYSRLWLSDLTTTQFNKLLRCLDARFRELGVFSADISTQHLKGILNGHVLFVVVDYPIPYQDLDAIEWHKMGFFPATRTPLRQLFIDRKTG